MLSVKTVKKNLILAGKFMFRGEQKLQQYRKKFRGKVSGILSLTQSLKERVAIFGRLTFILCSGFTRLSGFRTLASLASKPLGLKELVEIQLRIFSFSLFLEAAFYRLPDDSNIALESIANQVFLPVFIGGF